MEPNNNGIQPWQWALTILIILVIIGLGGYMIYKGKSTSSTPQGGIEEATPSSVQTSTSNRISMSNQFPGNIVYVSSLSLVNGGFVAVHKDKAGAPGAIIGVQYFEPGTRPGSITLTEKTEEGGTYYAVLHADDGDKSFDESKDLPILGDDGQTVMQSFKATVDLPEDKG